MKKLIMLMVAALVALALVGCMNKNNNNKDHSIDNNAVEDGVNNKNNTTENNVDNGVDHNGESRLDVSEDAANKVEELEEVDSATVIVTDNNAYVAVVLNNNGGTTTDNNANNNDTTTNNNNNDNATTEDELSKDLEDKIAEKVREVNQDVENVYVSLNPDFVERMKDYQTRINEGDPIEGFFDEFGQAVRNVFPDAR
ncbi:YhcN/YlaJ family sporulation lipoprotein [Sporosarcina ureilytica]|uniref:Lipoprotein YhcN n=1 Tax=Sporosarcina ureilytica TaxID=298596 RepID=A0A1D8JHF2_9BACL|nr:YhcN/YlaJ family sporulation lipoprotein [Sporosarcina ureilytica]AOV08113.1 hypothetical protein BI350_11575 [Sporosarcina ureilytica]